MKFKKSAVGGGFLVSVVFEALAKTIAGGLVVGNFLAAKFVFQVVVEQYFLL